eukprot:GILI01038655.1.p1 GENE.GILI01038655.1~~GILI01038655.1.p1  ORF type:complete len:163 (-),score=17.62 GILI01038655.1:37-525(-)
MSASDSSLGIRHVDPAGPSPPNEERTNEAAAVAIAIEQFHSTVTKDDNEKAMRGVPTDVSWTTPGGDEFTIKSVKVIGLWSIKIGLDETCPICREQLQAMCIQCLASGALGGDDSICRIAQLPCGHLFHHHCVLQWLQTRDVPACPSCQAVIYSQDDIKFIV